MSSAGFSVVHGSPQTIWCQIVDSDTIYTGQLLMSAHQDEGVAPLGQASGLADTTGKKVVFGVCVGNNARTPTYNSTYKTESITDASPASNTAEFVGMEGPSGKGGNEQWVQVAIVTPETVLRGPIFNRSYGTALPECTVEASHGHANQCTIDTTPNYSHLGATTVMSHKAYQCSYFRKGVNAGTYRITDGNSSINFTWDKALRTAASHNDVIISVNGLKPWGHARMQTDTESMFIDGTAAASANNWEIFVHRLDLSTKGQEFCEFRFANQHFDFTRA
jgi:hypothetical protein